MSVFGELGGYKLGVFDECRDYEDFIWRSELTVPFIIAMKLISTKSVEFL